MLMFILTIMTKVWVIRTWFSVILKEKKSYEINVLIIIIIIHEFLYRNNLSV